MSTTQFWKLSQTHFQRPIKLVDEADKPSVSFPVVLAPSTQSPTLEDVFEGVKELGPKAPETSHRNGIRQLLDENGGAVYFKSLPLRSAQEFSKFLESLAGQGQHAWFPHQALAMNVLRKERAKNVLSVNEYGIHSLLDFSRTTLRADTGFEQSTEGRHHK